MAAALALMAGHLLSMNAGATRPTDPVSRLDINQADTTQLRQLPGIGDVLARRIAEHRREKGPFARVEDLRQVRGIGPAALETLRPFILIETPAADTESDSEEAEPAPPMPERKEKAKTDVFPVGGKKVPVVAGRIDINRAAAEDLRKLPGIGPKLSERILEKRQARPFESVDDLRRVPGIGPKTLERIRPFVTVGSPPDNATLAR